MAHSRRGGREEDTGRGGRGGRGGGRRGGDGGFSAMLLIGLLVFIAISGGLVFAWYSSRESQKAESEAYEQAYNDWIKANTESFKQRANTLATSLAPIYNDTPTEKQTPELIAALSQKYGPTLVATGATYSWCKKSWSLKGQNYGANISPSNATQFLTIPTTCNQLPGSVNLMSINGQPTQSGSVSFYYDLSDNLPKAVMQLNLSPSAPAAKEGEGPPKAVNPTGFTLWFLMEEPQGSAKQALYHKMHPKAGQ